MISIFPYNRYSIIYLVNLFLMFKTILVKHLVLRMKFKKCRSLGKMIITKVHLERRMIEEWTKTDQDNLSQLEKRKFVLDLLRMKHPFGEKCNYSHDLESFIANLLPDIGETCVNFKLFGKCRYGVTCRFGKEHLTEDLKNIDKRDSFSQLYTVLLTAQK